jgi:hypothetical protein
VAGSRRVPDHEDHQGRVRLHSTRHARPANSRCQGLAPSRSKSHESRATLVSWFQRVCGPTSADHMDHERYAKLALMILLHRADLRLPRSSILKPRVLHKPPCVHPPSGMPIRFSKNDERPTCDLAAGHVRLPGCRGMPGAPDRR